MLNQIIISLFILFAAFVSAEAEGHGGLDCYRGRKGRDGNMGPRGPVGPIGDTGDQGDQGPIGDATNRVNLGVFRTASGSISADEYVQFDFTSSGEGFTVTNSGSEIVIQQNATYVVTYTVDAQTTGGPLYFQLELNGDYVPNSRYGLRVANQQIIGQVLVDVPEANMSLRLKCFHGTANYNTATSGQNNGSINIIRVGRSGLN